MERLNIYETSEPLAYYSGSRQVPQTILIIENKDTFYSMRRCLILQQQLKQEKSDQETLYQDTIDHSVNKSVDTDGWKNMEEYIMLGEPVHTLVYGAGKGILRSMEDFRFCVEPYMNDAFNRYLYFGDLDYEGIGIYEKLAELFASEHEIVPFISAYEKMLEKAKVRQPEKIDRLPDTKEGQNRNLSGRFFSYFAQDTVELMRQVLEADKYIPQEIINIEDL